MPHHLGRHPIRPFCPLLLSFMFLFFPSPSKKKLSEVFCILPLCFVPACLRGEKGERSRGSLSGNKCEGDRWLVPWNEIPGGRQAACPGTVESVENKHSLWHLDKELSGYAFLFFTLLPELLVLLFFMKLLILSTYCMQSNAVFQALKGASSPPNRSLG